MSLDNNVSLHDVRVSDIKNYDELQNIVKNIRTVALYKRYDYNEYILNIKYIDTSNEITKEDIFELSKTMVCCQCKCYIDILKKGTFTIDAINPLMGHTKNN